MVVSDSWTVTRGHSLYEEIELALLHVLPECTVFTHLEAKEDPVSFKDIGLDREPFNYSKYAHPVSVSHAHTTATPVPVPLLA